METPYRNFSYYDSVVREFLVNNEELIFEIDKDRKGHGFVNFDAKQQTFNLARKLVEVLQDAGATQYYLRINDKVLNRRYAKYCTVTGIEVGENRHQDGTPVVAFKVHYEGDSTKPDHKIIERIIRKDQLETYENRMYEVSNQYVGYLYDVSTQDKYQEVYEIGKLLIDFYMDYYDYDPSQDLCKAYNHEIANNFIMLRTKLVKTFNLYFTGYKIGDIVDKRHIEGIMDPKAYMKMEPMLEITKLIIDEKGTVTYVAASPHNTNKKYNYRAVFTRKNMKEIKDE